MSSQGSSVEGRGPEEARADGEYRDDGAVDEKAGGSFWVLLVVIVAAAAILITIQARRPKPVNEFAGQPLPPLMVEGWLNTEKPLSAADLQGKIVLVDYWASWCKPCLRGLPDLIEFRKRYRDVGVIVVGLTGESGRDAELVKNIVETRDGFDWPVGYGADAAFRAMNIEGIPTYVLYDRSGVSVWGGHSLYGIEEALVPLLAK